MNQLHLSLSDRTVTRLTDLLDTIADAPGISECHRYEVAYARVQVARHLPAMEGLVLAGLLHEAPERLAVARPTRTACRWWSTELVRALGRLSGLHSPILDPVR
jgi:hypothetical protein